MTELERKLLLLVDELEWPPTPALGLPALPARHRRTVWRPLLVAVAVLLVAACVAALVPGARSAILHWFRIGGASVERVETLPPAERRSLAAALGRPVGTAEGERALGAPVRLPRRAGQLYLQGGVVSALLETGDGPVLLSELRSHDLPMLLKKLAGGSTSVDFVTVAGGTGAWIAGANHVVVFPSAAPRLAGNTLLWESAGITYRLEGARLDRKTALAIARSLESG
jgi:hypothetical protein